jgi:hypothetical protein
MAWPFDDVEFIHIATLLADPVLREILILASNMQM